MKRIYMNLIFFMGMSISMMANETLKIRNQELSFEYYKNTNVIIEGDALLKLRSNKLSEVLSNSTVDIKSEYAWICFENISAESLRGSNLIDKIYVNGEKALDGINVEIKSYYSGSYIRLVASKDYSPVILNHNSKRKQTAKINEVYINDNIPVGDNNITEFYLKRGNMIVLADNPDGTGNSQVFMAIDHDCDIKLEDYLANKVSFMRVTPWNYVSKRGLGGLSKNEADIDKLLGAEWYYNWGTHAPNSPTLDFAPMFWGRWGMEKNIDYVTTKQYTNHILSFNEPDNKGESNIDPVDAAKLYIPLLKSGLRMGSPACCEGVWKTWLSTFMDECRKNGARVDFICIHWYDWGNWCSSENLNPDIDKQVARFKADIDACYEKYKLPIWITEFNANKNRPHNIHTEFLNKAIIMLEEHPAVERYAYFQPFGGNGNFFENRRLTEVGKAYGKVKSNPSVKEINARPLHKK